MSTWGFTRSATLTFAVISEYISQLQAMTELRKCPTFLNMLSFSSLPNHLHKKLHLDHLCAYDKCVVLLKFKNGYRVLVFSKPE